MPAWIFCQKSVYGSHLEIYMGFFFMILQYYYGRELPQIDLIEGSGEPEFLPAVVRGCKYYS